MDENADHKSAPGESDQSFVPGTGREITDQAALRESESNLSALLENVPEIILSIDRDYRLLTINSVGKKNFKSILNVDVEAGQNILDLIPPPLKPLWQERYDRALAGERFTLEDPYESDGVQYFSEVSFNPIRDGEKVTGVSVFSRDISERKRAEAELRTYQQKLEKLVEERTTELKTANKELEAFAYSVSHDLRAPLRSIDGFTRILMEDYVDHLDDEGKRLGTIIRENTQKMGQLIDDLLTFSRMGRVDMEFSDFDMKSMVDAVFEELTLAPERERIDFRIDDLPRANADHSMIRQVWRNLISNALKFSAGREKAQISVSGGESDHTLLYRIQDNGAGFDMRYMDKLFGVFQRLHSEKEFKGTGVGLALVQRIIHRHGGEVRARAKKNEGATFEFSLPRHRSGADMAATGAEG